VKIEKGKLYKLYLLTHTYIKGELKIGKTLRVEGLDFELVWSFTKGKEWISGFRKPAVEMLLPGTVLLLKAKDEGCLKRLTYIEEKTILPVYESKECKKIKEECISLHNYGWNYAILVPFREV
jgi:CRISPR-associated protein Cmr3